MRKIWTEAELTERGRLFLEASVGKMPVDEACEKLGISRQRFYELEDRAVGGFLNALRPRAPGRPGKPHDPSAPLVRRIEDLERENQKLLLFVKVLRKLAGIEERGKKRGRRRERELVEGTGEASDR